MDYKEHWDEMKTWLLKSIHYLTLRHEHLTGLSGSDTKEEQTRVRAKLEGLRTAFEHMKQTEKIYKEDDNNAIQKDA